VAAPCAVPPHPLSVTPRICFSTRWSITDSHPVLSALVNWPNDQSPARHRFDCRSRQSGRHRGPTQTAAPPRWQASNRRHHLLTPSHPNWPKSLTTLPDAPAVLYAIGDPSTLARDQIAIVGARQSSSEARILAKRLACELSEAGFGIISGLALGIDTQAHLGCLAGGSATVAVLANHARSLYPAANRPLARQILASGGCVITETPLDQPLKRYFFPKRNRLISALSRGVVVVEAAIQSGTMTTAKHAAAQGREVMAVPGSVENPKLSGCHQLIRDGATLVTSAADVFECVGQHGVVTLWSFVQQRSLTFPSQHRLPLVGYTCWCDGVRCRAIGTLLTGPKDWTGGSYLPEPLQLELHRLGHARSGSTV